MAATRNPTDIPFASTSVWNIGIGSNAQWSPNTDADARQLHGLRGGVTTSAWGQPIYFGTASDPLVKVTNSDTLYPVAPQYIHIPINALPAAGSGGYTDAHMAFYDTTQPGKMWSYWGASFNNGHDVTGGISTGLGGVWDTTGDGISNPAGSNQGDYNFAVGVITDYDVAQGAINHMVRLAISCDALKSPGATWTDNIPWPNSHEDYYGPQLYTGNIVAGSTFGIPMSVNLNSLGLSQGGMMLAKALQNYGGVWRDSTGTNQVNFYSTPENQNNPLIQQMQADMAKIVPMMEVLRNQGPNSVNGGGTSVVPLLPPVSVGGGTTTPPPIVLPITYGTGPDSLVLEVCDDAYANGDGTSNTKGDATFTVSIDGKQIGGTFTTTASHAAGQDQDVTLNGYFGPGTHSVAVNFTNDAWGGSASTDRNLYVDAVTYNGLNTNQSTFLSGPAAGVFTVSGGSADDKTSSTPTILILTPPPPDTLSSTDVSRMLVGSYTSLQFVGGAEAVVLVDGTLSVGAGTTEAFIARLYLGLLGRAADPNGLAAWASILKTSSKTIVAQAFLNSNECQAAHAGQDDGQFVNSLYRSMLGRGADAGGVAAWTHGLAHGVSRGETAAGFADSPEAKQHWSGATSKGVFAHDLNAAIVRQDYQTAFGRDADTGGLAHWTNILRSGETAVQLARDLTTSAEFHALHAQQTNTQYVESLYASGLGRQADAGGRGFWVNTLQSGASRGDVLTGIAQSAEGQQHLQWALG